MKRFHNTLTSLLTAVFVMFMGFVAPSYAWLGLTAPAHAVAPAGSKLGITVKVTHDGDTTGTEQESVGPIVELSPAAPTLSAPSHQSGLSGDDITYSYTITTNANGLDEYNLSAVVTPNNKVASPGPSVSFEVDSGPIIFVELGATVASVPQTTGNDSVVVPLDGGTDASAVNGIYAGDTVVIGSGVYEVSQVSYDSTIDNKVILLTTPLVSDVQVGDLIAERQSFSMTISGASLVGTEPAGTVVVTVKATSASDNTLLDDDESITSVVAPIQPSLETYVRNDTTPTTGGAVAYTSISGKEFFGVDVVTAKVGDTVEYAIVQKAGNTGPMTNVKIMLTLAPFSTYVFNSTAMNNLPIPDGGCMVPGGEWDGCPVWNDMTRPGTIDKDALAEVTFKVTLNAATVSTATPTPTPAGPVAWTEGAGDACWSDIHPFDGTGRWVVGGIALSTMQGFANDDALNGVSMIGHININRFTCAN